MIVVLIQPYFFQAATPQGDFRITVNGDFRITTSGDFRVIASAAEPGNLTIDLDTLTIDSGEITIDQAAL